MTEDVKVRQQAGGRGTCFVVMGFGTKTDFETGRTFDLNLTYKYIIKPAVESAGLECIRADEIVHSGPIDVPMYEQLLNADIVIADLSTSNKNAYYELGVRHALRPYSTIVICEDGIKAFPFDVNHVLIRTYRHLGNGIDYGEVERFRKVLQEVVADVYNKTPRPRDSPVYTFLSQLTPPALAAAMQGVARAAAHASPTAGGEEAPAGSEERAQLYSELFKEVDAAQAAGDFEAAKTLLKLLRKRMGRSTATADTAASPSKEAQEDPYIIQRLALVTYKARYPTLEAETAALEEARDLLQKLNPATSNDTETLGLWGAVHKRLWEKTKDRFALDKAIRSYERGFYLRNDHYNGINLAFLLNVRAGFALERSHVSQSAREAVALRAQAIADFVRAEDVREQVRSIADKALAELEPAGAAAPESKAAWAKNKYWLVATKAEASLGMGRKDEAEALYADAYSFAPEPWMIDSAKEQRNALEALLALSPLSSLQTAIEQR